MITQKIHNPQNLTPEQVGVKDGWRLLYVGEVRPNDTEYFTGYRWKSSCAIGDIVSENTGSSIRTKQPSPFADGWIKMSERKPTGADLPVWWYWSRSKDVKLSDGMYTMTATYWKPANITKPAPPVVELTQAQKDEAAFKDRFGISGRLRTSNGELIASAEIWRAALAYARSEKGRA